MDVKIINKILEKQNTLKLVQEGVGDTLKLIDTGNDFLNRTQMVQKLRESIDK
jgi:hypothetical protein